MDTTKLTLYSLITKEIVLKSSHFYFFCAIFRLRLSQPISLRNCQAKDFSDKIFLNRSFISAILCNFAAVNENMNINTG